MRPITLIFDMCRHNSAAVTPVKSENMNGIVYTQVVLGSFW